MKAPWNQLPDSVPHVLLWPEDYLWQGLRVIAERNVVQASNECQDISASL
jgi:hypothetical protein